MKYSTARHWPSFSSMKVTVSTADCLFAKEVWNNITTYYSPGVPGRLVVGWPVADGLDLKFNKSSNT
jgi:hypothetical protein